MHPDRSRMGRALELARKGQGAVHPNPLVGAVLLKDGRVIGEGFHERCGAPHAEINALRSATESPRGAALYVNLEPCCHHGKTPPCTDAVIQAGIARVVIGILDPNPRVNGRGVRQLQEAGIEVSLGVMEEEAREMNRGFIHQVKYGCPWVTVKLALTIDGFMADHRGASTWITGEESRKEVHRLRAEHDAVLVGAGTVSADDPLLTVRAVPGANPIRVVVDPRLAASPLSRVFHTGEAKTVIVAGRGHRRAGVDTGNPVRSFTLGLRQDGLFDWLELLRLLHRELGILSVLVEGGAGTAGTLLASGLVDELIVMSGPKIIGQGLSPFHKLKLPLPGALNWRLFQVRRFGDDLCARYRKEAG